VDGRWATKSEGVGLIDSAIIFPRIPTYVITVPDRHRRTDGQTKAISVPRYALVHRAVKIKIGVREHARDNSFKNF